MMAKSKFQAMIVTETEDGRFLRTLAQKSVDELPDGDVLIRVRYSSLNYKDALSAIGNKGVTKRYPHTPGVDAAGIVEETRTDKVRVGDAVIVTGFDLGMNTPGGYGQYIRVPAEWVVKLPEGLTLRQSMAYGTAGFTGALSVYKLTANGVSPDQGEVLVTGAPGGVGSIALSILAKSGFNVAAVNGIVDASSYLLDLGAKRVITPEEATDTTGRPLLSVQWAGVVDSLGGEILATALKSTKYGGTVTCCGNAASPELHSTVYPFILRSVSLLGIDSQNCPWELRTKIWEKLASEWKLEYLDRISSEVPLEEIDERIDLILAGKHRGRAVVRLPD
jgi:acrylyl-CoA reductase (NADPH)